MPGEQPPFGRNYGRSMVISQHGIMATSNALASQAGAHILQQGGSAADAAIAANAVLGVVEPMSNGIGGDLFTIYWEKKTGHLSGLNSSGHAPEGLSPALLASAGMTTMPETGIHAVTVPGAVQGWASMHQRFGRVAWKSLFRSAIAYAEDGFPVSEVVQSLWSAAEEKLAKSAESKRVFLPAGRPPRLGEMFRNPDQARAYRLLAADGAAGFYSGPIGAAILETSQALGGTMTREDLTSFAPEWCQPISTEYRGWRVYELPPNGQGMAALEMLNLMETIPPDPDGPFTAAELHKRIECMKLAYADVHCYNADPRTCNVPVAGILSKEYARERAKLIDRGKANCAVGPGRPPGCDTIYLTAVDREGNIASWIQSIYASFGSGIVAKGMGFPLQNRGAGFSLQPGHPNLLAGRKRPYHTIIPGFMERGDQHMGFGIMGGANQPLAHAQFVSNVVDYGMNLQEAMESPRFFKAAAPGCEVSIEGRVPEAALQGLTEMGHQIAVRPHFSQEMGRGQAILHDSSTGTNYAASDPRADGAASPEGI